MNVQPPVFPTISYLTNDALGSPRVITNAYGELKARRDFFPFGDEINAGFGSRNTSQKYSANDDDTRIKFATYQRDIETGLDFAQSRYFSPKHGRFTSPDEFKGGPDELFDFEDDASSNPTFYADLTNPQSLDKYQYGYNNPYKFNDPTGHCPPIIVAGIAIIVACLTGPDTVNAPGPGDPVYPNERGANVFLNLLPLPPLLKLLQKAPVRAVANGVKNQVVKQTVKQTEKQVTKLSKVPKSVTKKTVGGKFTKETKVTPGKGPGQSRSEMVKVKNSNRKTIKVYKDSFDRANKFQHRKHKLPENN